jgi:hypothetical protein
LVKTSKEGVKINNNDLVLNGKSLKLPIECPSNGPCNDFAFHLSNDIKKGTYQVVLRADIGDDINQKWYVDKVTIK